MGTVTTYVYLSICIERAIIAMATHKFINVENIQTITNDILYMLKDCNLDEYEYTFS